MKTHKMIQHILLEGGQTVRIGSNTVAWGRKHVIIFASDTMGASFSVIKINYMAGYVYGSYIGSDPSNFNLSFGYNENGNTVNVYMKSSYSAGSQIILSVIGLDLIETTTDIWSTDITPTKIS